MVLHSPQNAARPANSENDAAKSGQFTAPDLSILVVNWNTKELLTDCLNSIVKNRGGLYLEIIVVDNASNDGSLAMVQNSFPEVILLANQENLGFARANNQAMRVGRGRFMLLLNSDTIVQPGALANMVEFMDAHPEVGMVGPQLLNRDLSLQRSWARFPTLISELMGKNIRQRRLYSTYNRMKAFTVDWVGGAALMVRREAFKKVGGLDDRYFMYSEEMDWCYRVKKAGWRICYLQDARVIHLGGQSTRMASTRMKAELYRSKLMFFEKHYGRRQARWLAFGLRLIWWLKASTGWIAGKAGPQAREGSEALSQDMQAMLQMVKRYLESHPPVRS